MMKKLPILVLLCSLTGYAVAQSPEREADLKAAFIYNFTKYIEWENANENAVFVIGIIGSSPVVQPLQEIAKNFTVKDKRIIIRQFARPDDVDYCNILFIPAKSPFPLHVILEKLGKGVLTVSEENENVLPNTAFNFILKNEKLKFQANLHVIDAEGLKAGSQLLKLAILVN